MITPDAYAGSRFLAAGPCDAARVVLFGVPMDFTASFRPGSRFGPQAIRQASVVLETYSPALDGDLMDVTFCDAGDLALPFGNVPQAVQAIESYADGVHRAGHIPFALGGEHLISLPLVRAAHRRFPDLAVIHIDAHADLRTDYEGEVLSHATPFRLIAEHIGPRNVYSFAIRSGTAEEFRYARKALNFFPFALEAPLKEVADALRGRPVYVSIDIDVLDPAFAPGTGTPEPEGLSPQELFSAVRRLAASGVTLVGADVVEVAPAYDPSGRTAVVAAKLVRELLIGFFAAPRAAR